MRTPLNPNIWICKFDLMTLRLFASITEEKNIGRAASREAIAASAVTKRMHDLEDTLGFKLLYRDPKGTRLTPAGEIVERHVRHILNSVEDLHHELAEFADGVQGHVRIWATKSAFVEYLAQDISEFARAYPMVTFEFVEEDSSAIVRAVSAGIADVGVCVGLKEPVAKVSSQTYRPDILVAVMAPLHPLAVAQSLNTEQLLAADVIAWSEASSTMQALQSAATKLGRTFEPKYRVRSGDVARTLAIAGLGIAITPLGTLPPLDQPDRSTYVPVLEDWAQRKLEVFVSTDRAQSIALRTLLKHLIHEIS